MGVLYGTTSVCVGHPFDTIKTKMQAQQGFENRSMLRSFAKTVQEQGIRGLYRGCLPPLFGSGIFRSTQFAVFESVYTYMDVPFGKYELPLTGGLQVRVPPPRSTFSPRLLYCVDRVLSTRQPIRERNYIGSHSSKNS